MIRSFVTIAALNVRHRRLRSALTVLGISIGVMMILTLQLLGQGLRTAVTAQLAQFGSDLLFIVPGEEGNPFAGALFGEGLRDKDVDAIRGVPGIDIVMPHIEKFGAVEWNGESEIVNYNIQPVDEMIDVFTRSQGFRIAEGRWQSSERAREIVIGHGTAHDRYGDEVRVGDEVTIRGRRFTVSGILAPLGEQSNDRSVFFSLENWRTMSGTRDNITSVVVRPAPGLAAEDVAADIRERLERQVGLERFSVLTADKASALVGDIIGTIELVLAAIASIAVVVGGIGIMNTMYMTVLERTRDIGVMKAIGAAGRDILLLFLLESGFLGIAGGAIGIAAGSLLAYGAEAAAKSQGFLLLDVRPDPILIGKILGFALVFGAGAGLLPARRAAALDPVIALRYE